MTRKQRIALISKLEKERNSKLIIYFTSERLSKPDLFTTKIALDVLELFYEHLKEIGSCDKISLCVCSNGGNLDTPWPLVNLIREYCNNFEVLIPYKALSAATLIALGANKIVMPPLGQLSPIDPEGHYKKGDKRIDLAVEDVIGFIDLAKKKIGITEQAALTEILKSLVGELAPSILGSANRTHSLIRRLAKNMLRLHLKQPNDEKQIKDIVEHLTQELFSHQHFINRYEAREVVGFGGLIENASAETEILLNEILDCYYYGELETKTIFNPQKLLGSGNSKTYKAKRAFIESKKVCHTFETKMQFEKDSKGQVNIKKKSEGWKK